MKKIIEEAIKQVQGKSKPGDKIPVARYTDEESLRFFRPLETQTFQTALRAGSSDGSGVARRWI